MSLEGNGGPTQPSPDKGWGSEEGMILSLQAHIPLIYQDTLKDSISIVHTLFSKELPKDNNNVDLTAEPYIAVINNIKSFLETYLEVFKYALPVSSKTQTVCLASQNVALHVGRSLKKFREVLRKQLRGFTFLENKTMINALRNACAESLNYFDKLCSTKSIKMTDNEKTETKRNLTERIYQEKQWVNAINTFRKNKVIEGIQEELYASFRETIQNEFPMIFLEECEVITESSTLVHMNFYPEQEVHSFTTACIATVVTDFKSQIDFEKNITEIEKLTREVEQQLRKETNNLIAKNCERIKQHHDDQTLTEAAINQFLCSYKNEMASILDTNSGPPAAIDFIETQHCHFESITLREFKKYKSDPAAHELLQCRIFESFRELVTSANVKKAKELTDFKEMCKGEISNCLEKLEQNLEKYTQEAPKFIGYFHNRADIWLKDTIRSTTKDTIVSTEDLKKLFNRAVVPLNNTGVDCIIEEDGDKEEYIKSLVDDAVKYFIELTEASRRKTSSKETKTTNIRNRAKLQLEFQIQSAFGCEEPTAPYLKQLEYKMNEHVMKKLVKAMEIVDKKIDILLPPATAQPSTSSAVVKSIKVEPQEEPSSLDSSFEDNFTKKEPKLELSEIKQNDSCINTENVLEEGEYVSRIEETSKPINKKSLPLIFQFSVTSIKMGVMNPETSIPNFLPNEYGDISTPTIVGLTTNGLLVYGPEVETHKKKNSINCIFDLEQHFINHDVRGSSTSSVFIGGEIQKVGMELFLAFLFKKLKKTAEQSLVCSCQQTVITIPYWFASAQRVQIKDAGKIAGFSETTLVHSNTCAAYALANDLHNIREMRYQRDKIIMVLSETMEYVESTVYSIVETFPMAQIKMISHYGCDQLDIKSGPVGRNCTATDNVMELCKQALAKLRPLKVAPMAILGIVGDGNNGPFWRKVFQNVRMEYTGNIHCSILNENDAVVRGAVQLAQNLENIGVAIKDQIGFRLWRDCTKRQQKDKTYSLLRDIADNDMPKPGKPLTMKFDLRRNERAMVVYQNGLSFSNMVTDESTTRVGHIPVGYFQIFDLYEDWSAGEHKQFCPMLRLTNEGLISLDHVMVTIRTGVEANSNSLPSKSKKKGTKRKRSNFVPAMPPPSDTNDSVSYQYITANDHRIAWTTLNLNQREVTTFVELISKL